MKTIHFYISILLSVIVINFSITSSSPSPDKRNGKVVVCYVGTWAVYRPGPGSFSIDELDASLCSHIVYSFAGLNATSWTITSLDPFNDLEDNYGKGNYKKMTALKKTHPGLKVTLAIGGWNEGSANYSILAGDASKRAIFISSVIDFLKEYNFDGLDLDWEFPTKRGGKPEDQENFTILLKELKQALDKLGMSLTAAISASIETLSSGYHLDQIHKYLDLVHLMCYDYHGSWETITGPNAPLGPASDHLTVEASVNHVLSQGIPKNKLVVGLALYGRTFILKDKEKTSGYFGESSIENGGFQGEYTRTNGFLGYNEICRELKSGQWEQHWDDKSSTPWASFGNKVITYDDPKSIKMKVQFVVEKDLAGLLTWSMDTDDFRGSCAPPGEPSSSYPLLRAINDALLQFTPLKSPNSASKFYFNYLTFIALLLFCYSRFQSL